MKYDQNICAGHNYETRHTKRETISREATKAEDNEEESVLGEGRKNGYVPQLGFLLPVLRLFFMTLFGN